MSIAIPLIIHERRNVWGRQIRPRAASLGARLVETRNAADLLRAVTGTAAPVIVVSLGSRPADALDLVDRTLQRVPDARVLVLDHHGDPTVDRLARQLGVVEVLAADIRPPELLERIARCIRVASEDVARNGWIETSDVGGPGADPIEAIVRGALTPLATP